MLERQISREELDLRFLLITPLNCPQLRIRETSEQWLGFSGERDPEQAKGKQASVCSISFQRHAPCVCSLKHLKQS